MSVLVAYLVLAFVAVIIVGFGVGGLVGDIALAVLVGIALPAAQLVGANWTRLRILGRSIRLWTRPVRLSVSYLIRIEVDGELMLIRGARYPDQFQPVGGVYKYTQGARSILDKLHASNDELLPIDNASASDLRIVVPGWRMFWFYLWFESGRQREAWPWREFYEELIDAGLLEASPFAFANFEFVRRHVPKLRVSRHAQMHEQLIADIYRLIPSTAQERELRLLKERGHADVVWMRTEEIRRRGARPGENQRVSVAPTAEWLL